MIKSIFSKIYTRNFSAKKKAYLSLYHSNDFSKIRAIMTAMGKVRFPQIKETDKFDLELASRQYYLNLFGGLRLEAQILIALGKNRPIRFFPLHRQFIPILRAQGIKVSFFWTQISFFIIMLGLWVRGFYRFLNFSFRPHGVSLEDTQGEPYIYFDKLSVNNLPDFYPDGSSYDIITWYINKMQPAEKKVCHNVKNITAIDYKGHNISAINSPLPIPKNTFRFLVTSLGMQISALLDLFSGKWWNAMLMNEMIEANRFDYIDNQLIAKQYLFYNSITFYRPLWTYKAEEKGASIISYFYSTSETIMPPEGEEENSQYVELMNWPEVWVWDDFQKKLFENIFIYPSNTKIVGPIHFGGRAIEIKKSTRLKVAIFDSPPFNIGAYFGFSTSNGLGLNEGQVHKDFLNDIVEVFEKFNVEFYFKPKRQRNKNLEVESYLATLKKHQCKNNFHILNGDIAASYVIENSDIVISFPFTSTGVIGNVLDKFSLYYDPTGKVSKEDKARHDLPLLSKKSELNNWVTQNIIEVGNK